MCILLMYYTRHGVNNNVFPNTIFINVERTPSPVSEDGARVSVFEDRSSVSEETASCIDS